MRVSIVIPCFRQAAFLRDAVGSSLAQTHPDVETIVVNDGSDDDTGDVAASFGDRIRYVEKRNGGLPSARNAGLAAASGRACLFLDADDVLDPGAVEWLAEAAGDDERALCVMGYRVFTDSPAELGGVERIPAAGAAPMPFLLQDNFGPPNSFLAPTAMLRALGGFDESLPTGCEDWDAWTQLVLAGANLRTVQRIGALYRDRPDSMSKDMTRMLRSHAAMLLKTHRTLVADASKLRIYALDLLTAEQRVLRRLYAHGVRDRDVLAAYVAARRELEAAGYRLPATRQVRLLRALFGDASERVYMALCRVLHPRWYAAYRNGFV